MSIAANKMPDSLKLAIVNPLLKKNGLDIDVKKNYSPVSNLPYVSKLIERVVVGELQSHIRLNDLEEY